MVAARLANMVHGGDRKSDQAANLPLDTVSQSKAASMLNVSEIFLAMVAARPANMVQGARTDLEPSANLPLDTVSQSKAASMLNVSEIFLGLVDQMSQWYNRIPSAMVVLVFLLVFSKIDHFFIVGLQCFIKSL